MLSRFTAKGVTSDDKDVILAYQLNELEFKVDLHIVPLKALESYALAQLENQWVAGEEFTFPESTTTTNPKLQGEDSILPENIRSEETGKIRSKQNEWAYTLLTAKLWESYLLELDALKKRSDDLAQYDRQLFEDAKSFWERVLEHKKERDISQDRLDKIKGDVNTIFEKLKTFRKAETSEFEAASAKLRDEIFAKAEDLKSRITEKANFKALLEEHKVLQIESRKNRYTKTDDGNVRKTLDGLFHYINDQRNTFFNDITSSRIKGLTEVVEKMELSLARDKKDLEHLQRKSESNRANQLEVQLIKLKTNMLNDTIASKEVKLKDIRATLDNLQKQSGKNQKREASSEIKPTE